MERVAVGLNKQKILAKPYHGKLNEKERKQNQEDWTAGKFPVICATLSFGMGVSKSFLKKIVNFSYTKTGTEKPTPNQNCIFFRLINHRYDSLCIGMCHRISLHTIKSRNVRVWTVKHRIVVYIIVVKK